MAVNPRDRKNMVGGRDHRHETGGRFRLSYLHHPRRWLDLAGPRSSPSRCNGAGATRRWPSRHRGTALFTALTMERDENERTRAFLHVWRSTDGGKTWSPRRNLGCSYDHEQIAVDHTKGRYAGRVYLAALYGYPVYRVGVFRSADDGRTFVGPVEAANGAGEVGINVVDIQVLSDGTLVVPYVQFEFKPERRQTKGKLRTKTWLTTSTDGGVTFLKPKPGPVIERNLDDPDYRRAGGFLTVAVDATKGRFSDRIYMAWSDTRFGKPRVVVSHSADGGETWTDPIKLEGSVPGDTLQFMPRLAVNSRGVVGIFWLDTREHVKQKHYHGYFAASVDGGASFLPSVRVSTAPSDPYGPGNVRPSAMVVKSQGTAVLSLLSAASRWPAGGDYLGLATDSNGTFWPLWPDARTGTFQLYTAELSVRTPARAVASIAPEPSAGVEGSLTDKIEFVFDPTRYDGGSKTAEIPVRLKNISKEAIYPPIRVEVAGFGWPQWGEKEMERYKIPIVVNAANDKKGVGAIFNLDGALGNAGSLSPGAQTGPVVLKLEFVDPLLTPPIQLAVTGRLKRK